MTTMQRDGLDEAALAALAIRLVPALSGGLVIHLHGDLGAGKTTFARALLQAAGVGERVKSPTYSLIESYQVDGQPIHHLDLYRLADPEEVEWLGLPDLADADAVILIEWPRRGGAHVPRADVDVTLSHAGDRRDLAMAGLTTRGLNAIAMLNIP